MAFCRHLLVDDMEHWKTFQDLNPRSSITMTLQSIVKKRYYGLHKKKRDWSYLTRPKSVKR